MFIQGCWKKRMEMRKGRRQREEKEIYSWHESFCVRNSLGHRHSLPPRSLVSTQCVSFLNLSRIIDNEHESFSLRNGRKSGVDEWVASIAIWDSAFPMVEPIRRYSRRGGRRPLTPLGGQPSKTLLLARLSNESLLRGTMDGAM